MEESPLTETDRELAIYNNAYIEWMNNVMIMIDHTNNKDCNSIRWILLWQSIMIISITIFYILNNLYNV